MSSESQTIDLITTILAFISLISCVYVCISIIHAGYNVNPFRKENESIMQQKWIDIIFFMCITDGLHTIPMIVNWFPQAFGISWPYSEFTCKLIGISAQFLTIQSPLWHILLAYNLAFLLKGHKISDLNKQRIKLYSLMFIIPFICTIIPIFGHDYGSSLTMEEEYSDIDCWLKSRSYQMIFAVVGSISVLIHFAVLIYAYYKLNNSSNQLRPHYVSIIKKMSGYIIVYFILRFFPLIERIYEFIDTPPFWLLCCQHIGITLLGIGNAFIFIINEYLYSNNNITKRHTKYEQTSDIFSTSTDSTLISSKNIDNDPIFTTTN